jgi:hypothetical protein
MSRITYFDGLLVTVFDGLPDNASRHSVEISGSGTGTIIPDTPNGGSGREGKISKRSSSP